MTKKLKQVCKCTNCSNEAEMELTCSMEEYEEAVEQSKKAVSEEEKEKTKIKGTGTCTNCGNEADMWIDI